MVEEISLKEITSSQFQNIDNDNNVVGNSITSTRESRTEARLMDLAKRFKHIRSMTSSRSPSCRPFGTARLTPGRSTGRQLNTPEPMIAIALSDMEYLMRSARSSSSSERSDRQPGCVCCCHIASGVSVIPRVARFQTDGGISTHTLLNHSDNRIATKIMCSDNNLYRVRPVYATIEPGQTLSLHIARNKSDLRKRDVLCVNILEADGSKEAKEVFEKSSMKPATINMALNVTEVDQNQE